MSTHVIGGRVFRIEETPNGRNLYLGRWLDTGAETWFLWSGGHWIEHPHDADCPDCRVGSP